MDNVIKLEKENPISKANCLSKFFFCYVAGLRRKGMKTTLKLNDIYKCLPEDESKRLTDILEKNWNKELENSQKNKTEPSLLKVICKTFGLEIMLWLSLANILYVVVRSMQPIFLSLLIHQYSPYENGTLKNKLIYGNILILTTFTLSTMKYQYQVGLSLIGMRIRVSCSSLIYRKLLRLSTNSLKKTSSGEIVNLLSSDMNRFDILMIFIHFLLVMPFQVVVTTYLMWKVAGGPSLVGMLITIIFSLTTIAILSKAVTKFRRKVAKITGKRIKLMSELINGIQAIKVYVWENALNETLKKIRKHEIKTLSKFWYMREAFTSISTFVERFSTFIILVTYTLLGNTVTPDIVFNISLFNAILQTTLTLGFPQCLMYLSEARVSVSRIQKFLMLQEKQECNIIRTNNKSIQLNNVEAFWAPMNPVLSQINANISAGALCAIVGQVGSGKSSILKLLLGEMTSFEGRVEIGGEVSYASQEPWIFPSTVQKNILFGKPYDKIRYEKVAEVCALKQDFKQFPFQDKTVVGEKGVSLSGGQKARINLARAVYNKADIYLLDDPLSAVDAHVGKHLFDKCILEFLNGTTRILLTHQLQYLQKSDFIIVLKNGRIEAQGTFEELSRETSTFLKLLSAAEEPDIEESSFTKDHHRSSILSTKSDNREHIQLENNEEKIFYMKKSPLLKYASYASNYFVIILFVLLAFSGQAVLSGTDYWTSYWANEEELRKASHDSSSDSLLPTKKIIIIYASFIGILFVLNVSRSISFYTLAMNASKKIHAAIFNSLLKAPMKFFHLNPTGRILNRFSKDIATIDEILPKNIFDSQTILQTMTGVLINLIISNGWFAVGSAILLYFVYLALKLNFNVSRNIKQLEGIAKSPVFSHMNSTFSGIHTVRCSGTESILQNEFDGHQDVHSSVWHTLIATNLAIGCWLELHTTAFLAGVIYSFIFMGEGETVRSSTVGLGIQQLLLLTVTLNYGIRQVSEMISNSPTIERVLEYIQLEKEEDTNLTGSFRYKLIKDGNILFQNVSLYYSREDSPVLKNLTFTVQAGEKIGVVGRTGAGKSSLLSALFRLADFDGNIFIDGIDTKTIPLHKLRKEISIIPQDPVLFSESVRYNLDPFNEFEDHLLWDVLKEVHLQDSIESLDKEIQEGGCNLSVGQRQLICLARAILRNNKILVLDEATANVDPITDDLIQTTIRNKFKNCTVLTIAHRLNTIIDSDKVLVMNSGNIAEFDHPYILLNNKHGMFYSLIEQTGLKMIKQLHDMARSHYETKHYEIYKF